MGENRDKVTRFRYDPQDNLISQTWIALQPIVHLETGRIIAHEALLRGPEGSPWESPTALFAEATRTNQRARLEAHTRHLAVRRLADLPLKHQLFINVDMTHGPLSIVPPDVSVESGRLVIEVSERQPIMDNLALMDEVQCWRRAGFGIALDDYGAGYSGVGALLALRPDIVKLDRSVVSKLHQDRDRRIVVAHMVSMCDHLDVQMVAEGIETEDELRTLRDLGVPYGQGFLLGRPAKAPHTSIPGDITSS